MLASASSLNDRAAKSRISVSFNLEFSLEVSNHPLPSSQDRASLTEVTRLGDAAISASRLAWGEKPQGFWADVMFELLLELREDVQGLFFCLEESPIASEWENDKELEQKENKGNKDNVECGAEVPQWR